MRHTSHSLLAALLVLATGILPLRAEQLLPKDESAKDPSLQAFLGKLSQALERRDPKLLRALVAPDVKASFGDEHGWRTMRITWEVDRKKGRIWDVLPRALALGGTWEGKDMFAAPYVYTQFPDKDPFAHVVAVSPQAVLRAEPKDDAPVVASVPHEILETVEADGPDGWAKVAHAGREAWISDRDTWSPVGPRVIIEKRQGRWLIRALVEGD